MTKTNGELTRPMGSRYSVTVRLVRGAMRLLAEVLMLKGVSVGDVGVLTRAEGVELVRGVRITMQEGAEGDGAELGSRDQDGGEERLRGG